MRLFIALEVPAHIRQALGNQIEKLRPLAPRTRWVQPHNVHLTLVFLGECSAQKLSEVQRVLTEVCASRPALTLRAEKLGTFGAPSHPKVAWVGVGGDVEALAGLQGAIAARTGQHEARAFSPHLTLARAKDPRGDRALSEAIGSAGPCELGHWVASEVVLFQSQPGSSGQRYEALQRVSLTFRTPGQG